MYQDKLVCFHHHLSDFKKIFIFSQLDAGKEEGKYFEKCHETLIKQMNFLLYAFTAFT